ncbi:hypothetical protein M885DRAFT_564376 [Pelagophyceae sp. CCMP2097]|nr:hypothetical protein M885DRAFT_564376 [Pelagophyceae sp. CCMP2097]
MQLMILPDEDDDDDVDDLDRNDIAGVAVEPPFSLEDPRAAAADQSPTKYQDIGKVKAIAVGTTELPINLTSASRLVRRFPRHVRIVLMLAGKDVAHAAIIPAAMAEYVRRLKASVRPGLLPSQPMATDEPFPASPAAADASTPPTGVPLGKQADVPHCRSHPKNVVESLRVLDCTLVAARASLSTAMPDVFNVDASEKFLQL